jgi:hypothetical protein
MPSIDSTLIEAPTAQSTAMQHATHPAGSVLGAVGTAVRGLALLAASVLLLPYVVVPAYAFHPAAPFSGSTLVNPYAGAGTDWKRANFHAHSHVWGGLTSGHGTVGEVRAAYQRAGYDIAAVSNYHSIDRAASDTAFVPVYEHGFSIRKTHQLVIGARAVTAIDFPLWQTSQAKQYVLAQLRDTAALTVIAHPYLRNGYGQAQLAQLSGYDLLEIRSHWNDASVWWDSVLTAGNPIYGIGNDDSHDVSRPNDVGVVWTMVNTSDIHAPAVLSALRRGAMYVVAGVRDSTPAALRSMIVQGDTITATFDRPMDDIRVIADAGVTRDSATHTASLSYVMTDADHYARIVASGTGGTLYLNPVIRADGPLAVREVPAERPLASVVARVSALALWLCSMGLLLVGPLARRRKRRMLVRRTALLHSALLVLLLVPDSLPAQDASTHTLPFKPGEYHEYDLKFGVLTVGSGSLSISGPDSLRGREVLKLRYEINGGIPLFRVHDVMESWFDPIAMSSLRFTQDLNEGPKHYSRHFDFFPAELIVLERGKARAPTVAAPLDDASFIFFVRTLPLEVGQTLNLERYFRPNANPVTIQVLRKETITVPAGTFNTVVVKPIIRTSGIFSEGGQAELWFSDDPAHTLIQMKAKLSFGSLSLYLRPSRNRH